MTNFKNLLYILLVIIFTNITYSSDLPNNNNNNKRSYDSLNSENNDNNKTKKPKTEEDNPKIKKERTQAFFKILDDIISNNKIFDNNTEKYLSDLIELGIDVNDDGWENNGINNGTKYNAISKNRIDIVSFLVKQPNINFGITYNTAYEERIERIPIILFTLKKNLMEITELLLKHHSLYNSMNNDDVLETLLTLLLEFKGLEKCNFLLSKSPGFDINSKFSINWDQDEETNPTFRGKTLLTIITILINMISNKKDEEIHIEFEEYDFAYLLKLIQWLIYQGADIHSTADKLTDDSTHVGYKPSDNDIIQTMYSRYQEYLKDIKKDKLLNRIFPQELINIIISYASTEKELYNYQFQPESYDEITDPYLDHSYFLQYLI